LPEVLSKRLSSEAAEEVGRALEEIRSLVEKLKGLPGPEGP